VKDFRKILSKTEDFDVDTERDLDLILVTEGLVNLGKRVNLVKKTNHIQTYLKL